MNCPSCKGKQSAQRKFCTGCGAPLPSKSQGHTLKWWLGRVLLGILALIFIRAAFLPPGARSAPAFKASPVAAVGQPRRLANIGDVVMVKPGPWVCASSKDALDEATKRAVRGDTQEMLLTLRRTRSFMLMPDGWQVKILDQSWFTRKVRVLGWLDPDDGRVHADPEETRIGRECWVPMEAVQ
jgi:hypothetical protein